MASGPHKGEVDLSSDKRCGPFKQLRKGGVVDEEQMGAVSERDESQPRIEGSVPGHLLDIRSRFVETPDFEDLVLCDDPESDLPVVQMYDTEIALAGTQL